VATRGELPVLPPQDRVRIEVPALPSDRLWDPRVSDFWTNAWQSPMRLEWDLADTTKLLRAAYQLDEFFRLIDEPLPGDRDDKATPAVRLAGMKAKVDALARLDTRLTATEARLGLDPYARRSLQWALVQLEIEEARRDEVKAKTGTPTRPARRGGTNPFRALES
jgi:hypothetical protein